MASTAVEQPQRARAGVAGSATGGYVGRARMPTVYIETYGCQMNVYDGERMAELLSHQGMTAAADGEAAELIVLNTCHIRERAAEKVYSDIGRIRKTARAAGEPKPLIAVAGCVAQAEGAEIVSWAKAVDIVVGPQERPGAPSAQPAVPPRHARRSPAAPRVCGATPGRPAPPSRR